MGAVAVRPVQGQLDLTIINHVEPLDLSSTPTGSTTGAMTGPSAASWQRMAEADAGPARAEAVGDIQRQLADDAVNVFILNPPQWRWPQAAQGLWSSSPIFAKPYHRDAPQRQRGQDRDRPPGDEQYGDSIAGRRDPPPASAYARRPARPVAATPGTRGTGSGCADPHRRRRRAAGFRLEQIFADMVERIELFARAQCQRPGTRAIAGNHQSASSRASRRAKRSAETAPAAGPGDATGSRRSSRSARDCGRVSAKAAKAAASTSASTRTGKDPSCTDTTTRTTFVDTSSGKR